MVKVGLRQRGMQSVGKMDDGTEKKGRKRLVGEKKRGAGDLRQMKREKRTGGWWCWEKTK